MRRTGSAKEAQVGKRWEDTEGRGFGAEAADGLDTCGREDVVNVLHEVVPDGGRRDGDSRGPLQHEIFAVGQTTVARPDEVVDELGGGGGMKRLRADGPDCGNPRQIRVGDPLLGKIEPGAWADVLIDESAGFEGEEGGVADEQSRVGL